MGFSYLMWLLKAIFLKKKIEFSKTGREACGFKKKIDPFCDGVFLEYNEWQIYNLFQNEIDQ